MKDLAGLVGTQVVDHPWNVSMRMSSVGNCPSACSFGEKSNFNVVVQLAIGFEESLYYPTLGFAWL